MNTSKWRTAAVMACILISGLVRARAQTTENEKLESFFRSYLDERFRQRPVEATKLGDHRFDSLLDDVSRPARDGWLAHTRKTLKELPKRVRQFEELSREKLKAQDIWDRLSVFSLLAGLLAVEWFLRRRLGLV